VDGRCSTHGIYRNANLWPEHLKERDNLFDLDSDGGNIKPPKHKKEVLERTNRLLSLIRHGPL
jgi:hypothetical protein